MMECLANNVTQLVTLYSNLQYLYDTFNKFSWVLYKQKAWFDCSKRQVVIATSLPRRRVLTTRSAATIIDHSYESVLLRTGEDARLEEAVVVWVLQGITRSHHD